MTYDMRYLQDFLAELDQEELLQAREAIDCILRHSHVQEQAETGKRPHIAMPERRAGSRYAIQMKGRCWDAVRESPVGDEKRPVKFVDISQHGCSFICDPLFYPSQILSLQFRPPHSEEVQEMLVEVVRARKLEKSSSDAFRVGCRAIDEKHVQNAQEFLNHQQLLRNMLDAHASINILCVVECAEDKAIADYLKKQDYNVTSVSSISEIATRAESHHAHLIICPAHALNTPSNAWLSQIRHAQPRTGIIASAASHSRRGEAILAGADQSFMRSEMESQLRICLERAYYDRALGHIKIPSLGPEKVLVAGRDEKHVRKIETLLLGQKYLVAQAHTHDEILAELDLQRFEILITAAEFFRYDGYNEIAQLRRRSPALVVIVVTNDPEDAALALGKDADAYLPIEPTRKELVECLEQAKKMVRIRTFIK